MASIVCDLNVWYDRKSIQSYSSDSRLVGTWVNVFELAQTPNWFHKTEFTRSAAVSLLKDACELRMDNPWARIAGVSGMSFIGADDYSANDRFELLSLLASGAELTEKGVVQLRSKIDERKGGLSDLAEGLGKAIKTIREVGNTLGVSSKRIQMDVVRSLVSMELSKWSGQWIESSDVHWKRIDLFIHALHEYIFGKESNKSSPSGNDFCDLFNLLYVESGEQFWTREKYWNQVIQRAGMGAYLYQGNEP